MAIEEATRKDVEYGPLNWMVKVNWPLRRGLVGIWRMKMKT